MKAIIFSDGGSRGNPGKAAIGYVIKNENSDPVYEYAMNIGIATNNIAEYRALTEALKQARALDYDEVEIYLDSQLVEKQIKGQYKVKSMDLIPLFNDLKDQLEKFKIYKITHIKRELNKRADKLVNEALDLGETVLYDYRGKENKNNIQSEVQTNKIDKIKNQLNNEKIDFMSINILDSYPYLIITLQTKDMDKTKNIIDKTKHYIDTKNLLFRFI